MKKKNLIFIFLALGLWNFSHSQKTEVEKYYVRIDTLFISKLTQAYNTSTEELLKTLEVKNDKRENLGFGYQLKTSGKGVGSISFNYKILYYKNDVVAYDISTYIKNNKSRRLKKLYKERLSSLFKVGEDYTVEPIQFGIKNTNKPLKGITEQNDTTLHKVMSPFSGIIFGYGCGHGLKILKNREIFDELIEIENCEYLLYSKNPATRLMAIEFYYCNANKFHENQKKSINLRINELQKVPSLTRYCYGSMVISVLTTKAISEFEDCKH